jgi:Spy/CpxP family protein refolding chaperone
LNNNNQQMKIKQVINRTLTILSLLMCFSIIASAQETGSHHEKITAQRIAFITSKLDLTPTESQNFWPVYNEYDQKQHQLMHETRNTMMMDPEKIDALTEKEANDLADNQIVISQKMVDLRKEYNSKFKSVLPAKKVLKLYNAEREFQKTLIDRLGKPPK